MTVIRRFPLLLLALLCAACSGEGSHWAAAPAAVGHSESPEIKPLSPATAVADAAAAVAAAARPISGGEDDHAELLAAAAGARRILLGESTHGTSEFYRERARLTERLVRSRAVDAIAIEGDWTPVARLNLYVRGLGSDRSAAAAMAGFTQFPRWMWGNQEFRDFVERLRALNLERPAAERVGLYGMDVYDLFAARDSTLAWLRPHAPDAHRRAQRHYRCFTRYRTTSEYGDATRHGVSCRNAAEAVLAELRALPPPSGGAADAGVDAGAAEMQFAALRSAASVAAAEDYFRTASSGSLAWNVRDRRMADTVDDIAAHAARLGGGRGGIAIWAHNSHVGDARATSAANRGELNLGQLMRERHGDAAFLIGLFSYQGRVMAAPEWGAAGRVYEMRPAAPGSWSALLHAVAEQSRRPAFSLLLRGDRTLEPLLGGWLPQRAIGVVYRPHSEQISHYFNARLARQIDGAIFFDRSAAVTPLHR